LLYPYSVRPDTSLPSIPTRRSSDLIRHALPLEKFTPAVGQGSIAVESHVSLDPTIRQLVIEAAHHVDTGYRLAAERSYLRVLERSEEHTSELQSRENLVCRLLLEKK